MKKIISILILFSILFSSIAVFAHPGGTDSQGGHYDRQNGGYHFHHGKPAHQHSDGVCPYDFEDTTNHNSNNQSDNSTKNGYTIIPEKPNVSTDNSSKSENNFKDVTYSKKEEKDTSKGILEWIGIIFVVLWFGAPLLYSILVVLFESFEFLNEIIFKPVKNITNNKTNEKPILNSVKTSYLPAATSNNISYQNNKLVEQPNLNYKKTCEPLSNTKTYFTPNGKCYHSSIHCDTLKNSPKIYSRYGRPVNRRACSQCWIKKDGILYPKD